MPTTVLQLKTAVAGFMQRDQNTFLRQNPDTGVVWDVLLQACNNARLYSERRIDFEYNKFPIQVPNVTLPGGGNLDDATLFGDPSTPKAVKKIISPMLPIDNSATQFPIDLLTKRAWNDRLKRRFEGARPTDTSDFIHITESPFSLVQQGKVIMIVPPDSTAFPISPFTVYADAVCWMTVYVTGQETDFLLDFAFDWLMYRAIQELNFFVKEDERVQLSATMVKEAWDALVLYNNELTQSMADDIATLD